MNQAQYNAKKQAHLRKAELRKAQSTSYIKAQRSVLATKIKEMTAEADKSLLKWNKRTAKWDARAAKWSK